MLFVNLDMVKAYQDQRVQIQEPSQQREVPCASAPSLREHVLLRTSDLLITSGEKLRKGVRPQVGMSTNYS
jgi:hypothetical protein